MHRMGEGEMLLQFQNVLHVVNARLLVGEPDRGADGTGGESQARAGLMGQFDSFAIGGE